VKVFLTLLTRERQSYQMLWRALCENGELRVGYVESLTLTDDTGVLDTLVLQLAPDEVIDARDLFPAERPMSQEDQLTYDAARAAYALLRSAA